MKTCLFPFAMLFFWPVGFAQAVPQSPLGADTLETGLSSEKWIGLKAAFDADRHAAFSVDNHLQMRNPRQGWVTEFDGRGFTTVPKGSGWTWGLELEAYGFKGEFNVVGGHAVPCADGADVSYSWSENLEEWFINDERGLEHGYTLWNRPSGQEGPLTFDLAVR